MKRLVRLFALFFALFLLFSYIALPKISYELLGGKEIVALLNPPMLPSDQPDILRLEQRDKAIFRLSQLDMFMDMVAIDIIKLPRVLVDYLNIDRYRSKEGMIFGIFADPLKNDIEELMRVIRELEPQSVGVRIYLEDSLFKEGRIERIKHFLHYLQNEGFEPFVVLAQTYKTRAIEDKKAFFLKIFDSLYPLVKEYQIGEAINRAKWGVPMKGDYKALYDAAFNAQKEMGVDIMFVAPSVIDFEWYYTLYYVSVIGEKNIDVLNTLLYVDRRGAPENTQYGFDSLKKMELMKSIMPKKPLWITEVNWPLKDTGSYKPTSNKESVSIEDYASFMVRYHILAFASGVVDRLYWWQLAAKGYGLIDHITMSKSRAFYAYKFMLSMLKNVKFLSLEEINGVYSAKFYNKKLGEVDVYWCNSCEDLDSGFINIQPNKRYYNIYGEEIEEPKITSSPIYVLSQKE